MKGLGYLPDKTNVSSEIFASDEISFRREKLPTRLISLGKAYNSDEIKSIDKNCVRKA